MPWASSRIKKQQEYHIPLDPPLQEDLGDMRPRLIAMEADAKTALGISDIVIEKYTSPRIIPEQMFLVLWYTFLIFFSPKSYLYSFVGPFTPEGFANFFFAIRTYVCWFVVLVHSVETIYFAKGQMRRHDVPVLSRVWWKWVGCTMVEGMGAQLRFGKLVDAERRSLERKKREGGH